LAMKCHVLVQNLRPGTAERLGIGAARLHAANPELIHLSIEAFYPSDGGMPGFDLMVQAESGLMDQTGEESSGPVRMPASVIDYVTGVWSALTLSAELHQRTANRALTISMLDVALGLLSDKVAAFSLTGLVPRRMGSAISTTTPLEAYPTRDGYVVIGATNDKLFEGLSRVLDVAAMNGPRFATQADRLEHRDELKELIVCRTISSSTDELFELLRAEGVPVGRVRPLDDATDRHRRFSATGLANVPGLAHLQVVAPAFASPNWSPGVPGAIGRDSRAIIEELTDLDGPAIDDLITSGVVVTNP